MKISIDKEKCIGCGSCVASCPDAFVMDGDKAKVKSTKADKKCVKEAADTCPTQAISVA